MQIRKYIDKLLGRVAVMLVRAYQYTLSPDKGIPSLWLKGRVCCHEPHCSQYSVNVFRRYGFFRGLFRTMDRVAHCTGSKQKIYDPDHYRVVFFSSAPIGVPFLEVLCEDDRFDLVGVVTMPDAPSGRGMKIHENIIKTKGKKINMESDFLQTPKKLSMIVEWLKEKDPDFLVVIAYGKIIPQSILDIPRIAPINVHGSLLPKYRGASPIQSVFLYHEQETGITIMKMDATMDTGDMIDKVRFKVPFDWTVKEVIEKMKDVGPKFLTNTLWKYGKKILGEVKQKNEEALYCEKIEKKDGLVDPRKDSLLDVYAKYRAYFLWPKIYFFSPNGPRVVIENIELDENLFEENKDKCLVDNPCVKKLLVKPEGKSVMEWGDFVNGYLK